MTVQLNGNLLSDLHWDRVWGEGAAPGESEETFGNQCSMRVVFQRDCTARPLRLPSRAGTRPAATEQTSLACLYLERE
jgi:hypothetical protein